ncbi:DUF1380 family protein [Pantoea septica]|uniref:DUF1380 family protein n=1 Tax=Pantoea septica TaxID=472695 RepID=UPI0023F63F04|nr:DUF1380 family protein [Pantoea septica]
MYGKINTLCARLLQQHRPYELITLIVWTKEDVLAVLDDEDLTEDDAAEILSQIGDLDGLHDSGIGEDTLRVIWENMREREAQAREALIPAEALKTVIRLAARFLQIQEAKDGTGSGQLNYPFETLALEKVKTALNR